MFVKPMSAVTLPSPNRPRRFSRYPEFLLSVGAANRTRTCDPVITNDVLYQLSYCGGPNRRTRRLERFAPDIGEQRDWQGKGRGLSCLGSEGEEKAAT